MKLILKWYYATIKLYIKMFLKFFLYILFSMWNVIVESLKWLKAIKKNIS